MSLNFNEDYSILEWINEINFSQIIDEQIGINYCLNLCFKLLKIFYIFKRSRSI